MKDTYGEAVQAMMRFDESGWPVVVLTSEGRTTVDDAHLYTSTLDRILAKEEPYALISIANRDAMDADPEAGNHSMKWLKANKPRIAEYCRGMAVVAEADAYFETTGQVLLKQGQYMYGCPVTVVRTMPEAIAWTNAQLQ